MLPVLVLLVAVLLVTSCAEVPPKVSEVPAGQSIPEVSRETVRVPKSRVTTLSMLSSRNIQVQPNRPINVTTQCSRQDELGRRTRLDLQVSEAQVQAFAAEVAIKGRGTCRFAFDEFEQVQKMPQVLLRHRQERNCQVRMWEEGARVTVAFNSCAKSCEGKAFDYLWPIVVETKSGRCY